MIYQWFAYLKADLLNELECVGAGHARRPQRSRAVLVVGTVAVPEVRHLVRSDLSRLWIKRLPTTNFIQGDPTLSPIFFDSKSKVDSNPILVLILTKTRTQGEWSPCISTPKMTAVPNPHIVIMTGKVCESMVRAAIAASNISSLWERSSQREADF